MSDNQEKIKKKLSFREDWPVIPYITCILLALIASILDFILIQQYLFQLIGIIIAVIIAIGAIIFRLYPRWALLKHGFPSLMSTARLQIVENHTLIKTGLYKRIHHPLYLGEIMRAFILPSLFWSLYGALLGVGAVIFLLFRIQIEEKMLLEEFGEEYEEYRRSTKKLIPFIY